MNKLILISHHLCPYVQRAVIALTEKGIDFEKRLIDLANKPDWFLAISPTGKVPILQTDEGIIFESSVILEYIEDTTDSPMHPTDLFERAQHRAWMEFGSTILANIAGLYSAPDQTSFETKIEELRGRFETLEKVLTAGPYFGGESFNLVDTVYGPIFRYFDLLDQTEGLDILTGLPKITAWRIALKERPSVKYAVSTDYSEGLRTFLKNKKGFLSGLMAA